MFWGSGESGCVDAFVAYWREVEEKARLAMDLEAEAIERPEPRRIKERADAIVGKENAGSDRRGDERNWDYEDGGWSNLPRSRAGAGRAR